MNAQPEKEFTTVSLDSAYVALACAGFLYAVSWMMGCSTAPNPKAGGGKKFAISRHANANPDDERTLTTVSGRKLTLEKMNLRAATSLQFSDEEYGVAFDAPKGYVLKEGELPSMDRGLGYLGPIPMHFAQPGGVRLATVEPPQGVHLGTNFVNEFFTISAHYGSSEAVCADFNVPAESRGAPLTRTLDGLEFYGFEEHSAASMHQYNGIYLHAFANETCYEIGYGIATAGFNEYTAAAPSSPLKTINPESQLRKLERILENVHINPPAFERIAVN